MGTEVARLSVRITADNQDANDKLDQTAEKGEESSSRLSAAFGKIGKAVLSGIAAGAAAVGVLTKNAIEAYADYEQLVGGVETLFGAGGKSIEEYADSVGKSVEDVKDEYNKLMSSQETVLANAANAFSSAGLSANEYMETVTSFSASLLQSLGGDTELAADVANRAIIDMSDNANKMGTDMASIQNAYQGFAKQNYTMLDNLKLGYGGTQEEMVRLIEDASKMTDVQEKLGITVDSSSLSFGNIVNAISVMQESMGIAGTTADEAATTIQGSLAAMKSSWANLLVGLADDTQDFDALLSNFVDNAITVVGNLLPRIQIIFNGIPQLINGLIPQIAPMIQAILPGLLEGAISLMNGLVAALPDLIAVILDSLPVLIDGIMNLILALVANLNDIILPIVNALPDIIIMIADALLTNLPILIEGVVNLVVALTGALPQIVVTLIEYVPEIIRMIATALVQSIPLLVEGVKQGNINILNTIIAGTNAVLAWFGTSLNKIAQFFTNIWNSIVDFLSGIWETIKNVVQVGIMFIVELIKAWFNLVTLPFRFIWENCKDTIMSVWETIKTFLSDMFDSIAEIVSTVFNAIKTTITNIFNSVKTTVTNIWNNIKNAISTPINNAKTTVSTAIDGIKTKVTSVFNSVKSSVTSVWNSIKTAITTPINNAKTTVQNALNAIKGFFDNLKLNFPNIKLPHFSITGSFSLSPPSVPHLSIEWYKKAMDNAMLLDSPTIFGVNGTGSLLGAGEAGDEVVAGSNTLMGMIQGAVRQETSGMHGALNGILSVLTEYLPGIPEIANMRLVMDTGAVVGQLAPAMDSRLGDINRLRGRGQ